MTRPQWMRATNGDVVHYMLDPDPGLQDLFQSCAGPSIAPDTVLVSTRRGRCRVIEGEAVMQFLSRHVGPVVVAAEPQARAYVDSELVAEGPFQLLERKYLCII